MRRTELNEVVVVATHRASRFTNSFDFNPRNRRQRAGEKLVLHFARDGDFILQTLPLVLLFNERADGADHLIKGLAKSAELLHTLDFDAMGEVTDLDKLR